MIRLNNYLVYHDFFCSILLSSDLMVQIEFRKKSQLDRKLTMVCTSTARHKPSSRVHQSNLSYAIRPVYEVYFINNLWSLFKLLN